MTKKKNIIISTIKTKIGNFFIECHGNSINKCLPTNRNINFKNSLIEKIEFYLLNYLEGTNEKHFFDLCPTGTFFQKKVWNAIIKVKKGQTITYEELAKIVSSSPRAVGNACASNPCLFFIPCHRVVNKNNGAGDYLMGKKIKRKILILEGAKI